MTEDEKRTIDEMSPRAMAELWRFAPVGHPLLQGEAGQYFKQVFFEKKGGFTPAISKSIGLTRP